MKKIFPFLLLWPLLAQAQTYTYTLAWDGVTPSTTTNVVIFASINDGAYFQSVTVPTSQSTAQALIDASPGNKIAFYAEQSNGILISPPSNTAVTYAPMQIGGQVCNVTGTGSWKVAEIIVGNTNISPFYKLDAWLEYNRLVSSTTSLSEAFIKPGTPCDPAMVLMTPGREYHQATNAAGITGLAVCTLQ